MNEILVLTDTRQQKDEHITRYFDENNILWQRATLPTGDYMAVRYDNTRGIYKDYSIIIDTKKDILEIAGNLCHSEEHLRIKREIARACDLGANRFIFLIADSKIKNIEDVANWKSTYTNVKGSTLSKVMNTMHEKYGIEFIFCKKSEMGAKILELLSK